MDHEGSPYLGRGMQLCEDDAFYDLPSARVTWTSKSAEQVHGKLNLAGDARLVRLDE
ncbi:MAG TPA: hypothetical protein VFW65_22580 [Pseudonocardiaceae bacterium]|nr:hypothetical protein [Pseudonocardiaceae bacterium]